MACEFPILTALQRMISFAHGTSLENARSMQQIGLNEAAARANSLGSHTPGAFFTHLLGPPEEPGPGLQMAYEWGLRHSPMPVVLIGKLPEHIFQELEASGLIITQPVPGAKAEYQVPLETVFYPASYPAVNQYVHWQIIDPYGARGEESSA
jgi:hypothetical protein